MSLCCDVIIWTFKSCQIYFFVFCVCVCVILWSTLDANIRCSSGVILNFGCKNLAGKLEIKIPNSSTFEQCLEICLCYWHQICWDYAYWKYRTKSIGFWPDEYNSCVGPNTERCHLPYISGFQKIEAYSETCQMRKLQDFAKIISGVLAKIIFLKHSIRDIW